MSTGADQTWARRGGFPIRPLVRPSVRRGVALRSSSDAARKRDSWTNACQAEAVGGLKRVRSAREVRAAEEAEITWWFRIRWSLSLICLGLAAAPILAWQAIADARPSLWVLVAASAAVGSYGVWGLKRVGPRPDKRRAYNPEQVDPSEEPLHGL